MGLQFLLDLPWAVTGPSLIMDLLLGYPVVRKKGIRGRPSKWTENLISEVYNVPSDGGGLTIPTKELKTFVDSHFAAGIWKKKNGWLVEQCLDGENLRPVFEFLIPILNPER
ncbi:unnamed protein product [Calypogeia fissa]